MLITRPVGMIIAEINPMIASMKMPLALLFLHNRIERNAGTSDNPDDCIQRKRARSGGLNQSIDGNLRRFRGLHQSINGNHTRFCGLQQSADADGADSGHG